MKEYKFYLGLIIIVIAAGCKESIPVQPPEAPNYSGQYQNLKYSTTDIEPTVTLNLQQNGSSLAGSGTFNDLTFNFTGTVAENHATITFDLLNTNVGDLRGCVIDGYFSSDYLLAGGYTLSYQMGTEKIRFRLVK